MNFSTAEIRKRITLGRKAESKLTLEREIRYMTHEEVTDVNFCLPGIDI